MYTNKQKLYHLFLFAVLFSACAVNVAKEEKTFYPQRVWNDTEGNPINAHGGTESIIGLANTKPTPPVRQW